jgi:hypothetical protein
MNVKERCSISKLFVDNGIVSFVVLIRKSINGFKKTLQNSEIMLVNTVVNSLYFMYGAEYEAE